jgi:hypothetical protein
MLNSLALSLAVVLAGCSAEVTMSSRSYLGPERSGATSDRDVKSAAREVIRLFEVRGYALADQRTLDGDGQLLLRLTKTARPIAAQKDDEALINASDVGSVAYVWVAPAGAGSTITMLAKPMLAGVEPCTNDGVRLPCAKIEAREDFVATHLSGRDEADLVHGVLSQLQLEGFVSVVPPEDEPPPPPR